MKRRDCLSILCGLAMAASAYADTVEIEAVKDNTLYEHGAGALSNGAGVHLFCGQTASALIRRPVIAFDVAGHMPSGALITDVQLIMTVSETAPGSGPRATSVHRLLADWGEGTSDAGDPGGGGTASTTGDATWIHTSFDSETWDNAGGDFAPVASATIQIDDIGQYAWGSTPTLVADAQGWLDDPGTNFGWIFRGDETAIRTAKKMRSRETGFPGAAPRLVVSFVLPNPIPAVADWGIIATSLVLLSVGSIAFRRGPRWYRHKIDLAG